MTQPLTRDMRKIIEAAEIMEAELLFQSERLAQQGVPDTPNEREHLMDLRQGYAYAARYVAILKRYQMGRLERQQGGLDREPAPPAGIDAQGRALPHPEG